DSRCKWMNQFGPVRIRQPQCGSTLIAKAAACVADALGLARLTNIRPIHRNILASGHLKRLRIATQIHRVPPPSLLLAADGAIAPLVWIRRATFQAELHRPAMTRSFKIHG